MTTSGTSTFNYSRDQIIRAALRKLGAISAGEIPDATTVQDASDQLNIMVKAWNATGIHIWTEAEATLFLQPDQISYILGAGSADHATESYTKTTLSVAAATSATTIRVTSATGFGAGFNVGVAIDDGTIFWSTQVGAAVGTTITLAAPLTDSAVNASQVIVYETKIVRPLRVVAGRRYVFVSEIDTPLIPLSRLDYRALPNKNTTGTITQFFYDPRGGAVTQGQLFVWPAPSSISSGLKFTWYRPIQDFTSAANTPDLPQEWLDTIIWNLAYKMAPEYDCPPQRYTMLREQAATSLDLAMGWDREPESVYFGVNFSQR